MLTSNEWNDVPDTLILRDTKVPIHDNELSVDMKTSTDQRDASLYEMNPVLVEPLRVLLRSRSSPDDHAQRGAANTHGIRFRIDLIELHVYVDKCLEAKEIFLNSVVKHFARIINADLITLTRDDLEDLADHFRRQKAMEDRKYVDYRISFFLTTWVRGTGACISQIGGPFIRMRVLPRGLRRKLGLLQHVQSTFMPRNI